MQGVRPICRSYALIIVLGVLGDSSARRDKYHVRIEAAKAIEATALNTTTVTMEDRSLLIVVISIMMAAAAFSLPLLLSQSSWYLCRIADT